MNATNLFTRRILGMDYRVWIAMLFVCFLSLGLYGYKRIRLTPINDLHCPTDTITVNGKMVEVVAGCYLNRYSLFGVQSEAATTVEWNFGDGTPVEKERIVAHKFIEERTYRVTATVNGRCESDVLVQVSEDPLLSGTREKPVIEIYPEPRYPTPGSTVRFRCLTDLPSVTSYEWEVLGTNEVKSDAEPTFTFNDAKSYTIRLKLNSDPLTETTEPLEVNTKILQVPVIPGNISPVPGMPTVAAGSLGTLVPLGAAPSTNNTPQSNNNSANNQGTPKTPVDTSTGVSLPKVPEVDSVSFKDLLQNVVDQKGKEPEDLYKYLYYKETVKVKVNESESLIPLPEFCKNMRKRNRRMRKIESLSFQRDDTRNIQVIKVKVPREGFWDRVNPFN